MFWWHIIQGAKRPGLEAKCPGGKLLKWQNVHKPFPDQGLFPKKEVWEPNTGARRLANGGMRCQVQVQ